MAKTLVPNYSFDASAQTVSINGRYDLSEILIITNVTDNVIIYNFSAPTKGGAVSYDSSTNQTTITLTYNTTSMSDSDVLQIYVDKNALQIEPYGAYKDAVDRFRVANPQALIDTDFEYSLQATKWESLSLQNNIPGIYQKANEPAYTGNEIVSMSGSTVTTDPLVTSITYDTALEGYTYNVIENRGGLDNSDTSTLNANSTLPFNFTVAGTTFNQVRSNSEGVLFFGSTATATTVNITAANYVNFPHLKMFAQNMQVLRYSSRTNGTAPNRTWIFRYEGDTNANDDEDNLSQVCYVLFLEGQNKIQIHYYKNGSRGTSHLSDGSNVILSWTPTQNTNDNNGTNGFITRDAFELDLNTVSVATLDVEVTSAPTVPFYVGQPVIFKETTDTKNLDRAFLIFDVISTTEFTVITNSPETYTGNVNTDYTTIYTGGFFYSAELPLTSIQTINGSRRARITFSTPHSLYLGSSIYVVDENSSSIEWVGAFEVSRVISSTQVEYIAVRSANYTSTTTVSTATTKVYIRNNGVPQHRFMDGGVQISPEGYSPNCQIIRQTRQYFRYQSGKSIQFSTGVLFKPTYDIFDVSVNSDGYDATLYPYYDMTITTEQIHGFNAPSTYRAGCNITISGFEVSSGSNPYNISATVQTVIDAKRFVIQIPVTAGSLPTDLSPGGLARIEVTSWDDAVVRTGLFDGQNGLFLEHDGQYLYAVRRASTQQLSGFVSVTADSATVTGTNTKFKTQLNKGNYVSIKGVSYLVSNVTSDTSITISPDYKGVSASNLKLAKTIDYKTRQDAFNIDKLDGTGPSRYTFNPNKMQMIFVDYAWYGAGKIRYGMRGLDGNVFYFHEYLNNNVNTEAYMRSGNVPGRFEIITKSKFGKIKSELTNVSTTLQIPTEDALLIPDSGTIIVNSEYINYEKGSISGSNTILNLINRNIGQLTSGNTTGSINDDWETYNQNFSPTLSHWGVSVLMDGNFNEDKSYFFTASNSEAYSVDAGATRALLTVRLAPSVDYGIPGFWTIRNLINRSILSLNSINLVTTGLFTITVKINGDSTLFNTDANWLPAGNGSIAQYIDHSDTTAVTGGDVVATFITDEGSNRGTSSKFDIKDIRGLSNSVLGGPNTFPDGPDTLTVFATNNSGNARTIISTINWTESQG